jgi:DNA-binding NarL/FixJ family response regulator
MPLGLQRGRALATQRSIWEEATPMERILLIEGHTLFRQGLALLLRWRLDLESVEAGSLAEGRRVLSDLKCTTDLAIVALDLPDGDGCDLIKQLRETKPDVPVLAFTASQNLIQSARAQEAGADVVLAKKVPVEQIVSTVRQIVRG